MAKPNTIKIVLVSLLLAAGGATSTHPDIDSGCPPGQTRVDDAETGKYDCASERDFEDMRDVMDEHKRRPDY